MEFSRVIHFVLQISVKPQPKQFGVQQTGANLFTRVNIWISVSFQKILPKDVKAETFVTGLKKFFQTFNR